MKKNQIKRQSPSLTYLLYSGGILLVADGGTKTRILDEDAKECWNLRFLTESFLRGPDNAFCGENIKLLLQSNDLLEMKNQRECWFNGNWEEADDPNRPELYKMMEEWIPVRLKSSS